MSDMIGSSAVVNDLREIRTNKEEINMADCVYWLAQDKLHNISDVLELFRNHDGWKNDGNMTTYLAFGYQSCEFQSSCDTFEHGRLQSPVEFLINMYREHATKRPFCDSIFDLKEQLVALQLVMAQLNKEETGEFTVQLQDVLETHKSIMKCKILMDDDNGEKISKLCAAYNKFLSHCNAVDFADILHGVKTSFIVDSDVKDKFQNSHQFVVVGKPKTPLEEQILLLITGNRTMLFFSETKEDCLSEKTVDSFLRGCSVEPQTHQSPYPSQHRISKPTSSLSRDEVAKDQLLQVFLSYLRLLVNSRDELALSKAINIPHRDLAHQQFTALRKVAREKNMPMFQTAVSFILRIRLGGKSYAPRDDNPLLPSTKGLGEFVTFFQKLQNICEETADTKAAVLRIINIVRVSISKSKERVFTSECLAEVVEILQQKVEQLSNETRNDDNIKSTMVGMKVYLMIQTILDQQVKHACVQDYQTSNVSCALMTPETTQGKSKVRSLLSQFRTPDPESLVEDVLLEEESPVKFKPGKFKKPLDSYRKVCGDMSWAKPAVSIKIGPSPDTKRDQIITAVNHDIISSYESGLDEQCVEGTPKCRSKKRTLKESMYDKENVLGGDNTELCEGREIAKPPAKRMLLARDTTGRKNSKAKATGKVRSNRKQTTLLQGQRQLTNFFNR